MKCKTVNLLRQRNKREAAVTLLLGSSVRTCPLNGASLSALRKLQETRRRANTSPWRSVKPRAGDFNLLEEGRQPPAGSCGRWPGTAGCADAAPSWTNRGTAAVAVTWLLTRCFLCTTLVSPVQVAWFHTSVSASSHLRLITRLCSYTHPPNAGLLQHRANMMEPQINACSQLVRLHVCVSTSVYFVCEQS